MTVMYYKTIILDVLSAVTGKLWEVLWSQVLSRASVNC